MSAKPFRWWFGETRTLEQQLTGLDRLMANVAGRSVLDVGCAEGAISIECLRQGARFVAGFDVMPRYVAKATAGAKGLNGVFVVANANTWAPGPEERYDVVLMLAILHKLRDPSAACMRIAACARELVLIRLPPAEAPDIVDPRSGNRRHSMSRAMATVGFQLTEVTSGPVAEAGKPEWTCYFTRQAGG